ncbi:MAG: tetratricopeptide repeat protein [Clostridium sp.]
MDQIKQIRLISNSFYNVGLERARIRDLTGAVVYLQKCLNLNKYHIEARNLLGLIYYEMGEISEALMQWVISMNFNEEENPADYYLDQVQRKPECLEAVSQNIRKYNQALLQAQNGSDDLAVLQLTRVVEANPKFVKAQLLLAMLYISRDDYTKAGKFLYKVLKIDKNNPKASWYMAIVKAKTGKADIEKKKLKNAFSHRQMQDDDVIMPPSYKENTGWQSVLNIGAGLLLGAVAVFFLIMPAKEKTLNTVHNQEILQYNEQLNQKNGEIKSLNDNMAQYVSDKTAAEDKLNELLNSNDSMVNQYAILVKMLQAYRENDLAGAVALYGGFNPSLFTDEAVLGIANGLKQDIETNGYQSLEDLAYTMWSAGRLGEALTYYQTCLNIRPANPKVLFNMGMINRAQNQTDTAIQLFTQVSTQFGDSEYAEKARTQLAELQPQGQPAAAAAPPLASIINPPTAAAPTEAAPIESAPTEAAPAA